jgi:sterol desaturase/sphingolipid hydroxylase (fatty acid hydroxylase superfamily)
MAMADWGVTAAMTAIWGGATVSLVLHGLGVIPYWVGVVLLGIAVSAESWTYWRGRRGGDAADG